MRGSRDHVSAYISRQIEMISSQIGYQQRGARCPPLVLAVCLHHARASRIETAAQHESVAPAGQRIVENGVGKREEVGLPRGVLRVPRVAARLTKTKVGGHAACARDVRHQTVKHYFSAKVLVEAKPEKVTQKPSRLRYAKANCTLDCRLPVDCHGVGGASVMAQKSRHITRCGKAQPKNRRIARCVGHLVQCAGVKAVGRSGDLNRLRACGPHQQAGRRLPGVIPFGAYRHGQVGWVGDRGA